jgi:aryl-alcohol dehydrogenase-like predicted oxidoreductase
VKTQLSRRDFLQHTAVGVTTAATLGSSSLLAQTTSKVPKRILGKTGLEVSILAFGGGSQFLKNKDGLWQRMLERAIEAGVNYFDTSSNYQWTSAKSSEECFGEVLPAYRKSVIISTKMDNRDVSPALKEFEQSLRRMKTDYVDVLMFHSIEKSEDIAALEKGLYKEMVRLKASGAARFIGFSSMNSSEKSKELMERLDVDVAILAMNPTQYGDFAQVALPTARQKNVGVIAMKVMRDVVGAAKPQELLHYVWTQPGVASAVVGHVGMETLEENLKLAIGFGAAGQARPGSTNCALEDRLAHLAGPHALCWARSDYRDGGLA